MENWRNWCHKLIQYKHRHLIPYFLTFSFLVFAILAISFPCSDASRLLACLKLFPINLFQVFHLAGHLLYWGKASIIYPICESNVYVISPKISNLLSRVVQERFSDKFPGESLIEMLSIFSLPTSISQRSAPTFQMAQLQLLTRVIVW